MTFHQSSLLRKVKRTLPSPPPEPQLLMMTPALPQIYVPSIPSLKHATHPSLAAKASLLKDLTHELKAVEQESIKLRKQQAELEEEEKEIDAKLRYLELGITQRKETLVKDRTMKELSHLRCMADTRDYMSDSELNNIRLAAGASSESTVLLRRPSTAPLSQFTSELNIPTQFSSLSSFMSYQHPHCQLTVNAPQTSTLQDSGFNQPPYPIFSQAQSLPQPTPLHIYHHAPSYQAHGSFPLQGLPPSLPPYPTDHSVIHVSEPGHLGFHPSQTPVGQTPYPTHITPYPNQTPPYPVSQPLADILTVHHRPRQTLLSNTEHNIPTNYEVISNPTVVVTTTVQDFTYSQSGIVSSIGQFTLSMANMYEPYSASVSSTYGSCPTTTGSSYGSHTTTSASSYGHYTTNTTSHTNGYMTSTASSYGQYTTTVADTYGQTMVSDHLQSTNSSSVFTGDGNYGSSSLEQITLPKNYLQFEDFNELTKEGIGTFSDPYRSESYGRHGGDGLHTRGGSSYGRLDEERDAEMYDHLYGRGKNIRSSKAQ